MKMSFKDVKEAIANGVGTTEDGEKKVGAFTKDTFEKLNSSFINELDYEVEVVKSRAEDGTVVKETIKPVQEFREKFIKPILKEVGIDSAECDALANKEINAKLSGFYDYSSELIWNYMETGRQFNLLPKDDFQGGFYLVNEEADSEPTQHRVPKKDEFVYVKKDAHKVIKAKSKCPKNKKHRVEK